MAMILADVNLHVYAFREDSSHHRRARAWMVETTGAGAFGVSDIALSAFLRLVTNSRVFPSPSPLSNALAYANAMRDHPNAVAVNAAGSVPDAYLAALAIEYDLELASSDSDFARFPGLRWTHPLA